MADETSILSKPSPVELYRSGLSGSAWLLFLGIAVIIASIVYYNVSKSRAAVLIAWFIGGILGFIGYLAITNALKVERLRLAAHMLRSLSLHAKVAAEKGGSEALRLVEEAERRERGFIVRTFRAAGADVEQAFAQGVLDGIRKGAEPPYILVYRNGVLDAPSTLAANLTARTAGAVFSLLAFMILGLVMLFVGVLLGSLLIYTTARTLKGHATLENRLRRALGLPEVPAEAPGAGGLIASILTLGLYLPIYARSLTASLDAHVVHG